MDLDHHNTDTNNTYIPVHKTNNQVLSGYTTFLGSKSNLVVDKESKKICNTYWTPKFHEHLYKASFKITAPQSSEKLLSKAVTSVLNVYKEIETYNSKIFFFFQGSNHFRQYKTTSQVLMQSTNLMMELMREPVIFCCGKKKLVQHGLIIKINLR